VRRAKDEKFVTNQQPSFAAVALSSLRLICDVDGVLLLRLPDIPIRRWTATAEATGVQELSTHPTLASADG
jgi:hypothetical protein